MLELLQSADILNTISGAVILVWRTIILFSVSVPVLSVHIVVQEPRVSTASNLRTTALLFAIFCIPSASVRVIIAGNPSGTAATARETAVRKFETNGTPLKN